MQKRARSIVTGLGAPRGKQGMHTSGCSHSPSHAIGGVRVTRVDGSNVPDNVVTKRDVKIIF